jgi:hypothetical protein
MESVDLCGWDGEARLGCGQEDPWDLVVLCGVCEGLMAGGGLNSGAGVDLGDLSGAWLVERWLQLLEQACGSSRRVLVLSRGAVEVSGPEGSVGVELVDVDVDSAQASAAVGLRLSMSALSGALRSAQREYARVELVSVDADPAKDVVAAVYEAVERELAENKGLMQVLSAKLNRCQRTS